ncbi:MAG: HAD family phosphatase [Flavobacterium sp.]|nr:MAG: HAD family phosphatase [Flavobacterium sp.]
MINTIIFDFGDVFLNLNKEGSMAAFKELGLDGPNEELLEINNQFETGKITEDQFLDGFRKYIPDAKIEDIRAAWNSLIGDFPLHRLEFLQMLCGKYRLFLLTNTDSIHIDHFEQSVGMTFSREFYGCFEKVYYSYEMGKRKPDKSIFEYIIRKFNGHNRFQAVAKAVLMGFVSAD